MKDRRDFVKQVIGGATAAAAYGILPSSRVLGSNDQVRIGVIGDFEPAYPSHFATNAALYDAATMLKVPLMVRWLPTPSLEGADAEKILSQWDGLIAGPGSPYKSFQGMLGGIEFARSSDWPFTGT